MKVGLLVGSAVSAAPLFVYLASCGTWTRTTLLSEVENNVLYLVLLLQERLFNIYM